MKHASTLIDTIYRATFGKEAILGWGSNVVLREKLVAARRFVLDEAMSGFLGELGTRAFTFKAPRGSKPTPKALRLIHQRLESLRVSAMAPHQTTWVEYKLRPAMLRSTDLLGIKNHPEDQPEIEGWLIEQHPKLETVFTLHLFSYETDPTHKDEHGHSMWGFPVMYAWSIDDTVPPWRTVTTMDATVATGITQYKSPQVVLTQSPFMQPFNRFKAESVSNLVAEWSGVIRRVWALLACIDDIPVTRGVVQANKGFVARGRYRRFLDHHTITLTVPHKQQARLAARAVAGAVKRRGHGVRAHWRINHWFPPSAQCPSLLATGMHAWTDTQECSDCHGRRIKIPEHRRGDASQGLMITDYVVRHDP